MSLFLRLAVAIGCACMARSANGNDNVEMLQIIENTKGVDALQVPEKSSKPLNNMKMEASKLGKELVDAVNRRRSKSKDPCACMSSWEYSVDNVTYEGCVETPDWKGMNWCWVEGGSECSEAKDSVLDGEERKWLECEGAGAPAAAPAASSSSSSSSSKDSDDPCACLKSWEYSLDNITYEGCVETPDWEGSTWCYVEGGKDCKKAKDSDHDGEERKWMECDADGGDAKKAKSAAKRANAVIAATTLAVITLVTALA